MPDRSGRPAVAAVLVVMALLVAPGLAGCSGLRSSGAVADAEAVRPLQIPPLAASSLAADGTRVFTLTAQEGTTDFGDGGRSPTIGFNGSYLGPTIRAARGERIRIDVTNRLDEATTVHWHGAHLPAQADGGPHSLIAPGATWSPDWTVDQPAATLWYHPHPHGQTAQQVYRGLAGMLLIDDSAGTALGLPETYGVDDLPIVVQDKIFAADGSLQPARMGHAGQGFLGDTLVVNGTVAPYFEATTELVRLRLLNASDTRIYRFGFDDGREFQLIGTDGGLLEAPVPLDAVQLSPGERAEIVVRLQPGESVALRSTTPDLGRLVDAHNRFGGGTFQVLQLRAGPQLSAGARIPERLATIERLDPALAQTTRTFRISGRAINGRPFDAGRIDEVVTVDQVEVWSVMNADPQPHSFHAHDIQWQVVDVDGAAPPPELSGWKDTVYVAPRSTVRLVMRFTDYTDPTMPYMFHCHLLSHEDMGLMGQFVVVQPGEEAVPPPRPAAPAPDDDPSRGMSGMGGMGHGG